MMRSTMLWASALSVGAVSAFQDTSPFFLFSTSSHLQSTTPQIVTASSLGQTLDKQLDRCPSDTYVLVSQAGANAADFNERNAVPHMRARMQGKGGSIASKVAINDVLGDLNIEDLSRMLQQKCDAALTRVDASTGAFAIADDKKPRVMTLEFPALPTGAGRAKKLEEHDAFLASVIDWLPSPDYTVIYTTTPSTVRPHDGITEPESYEMDTRFGSPVHMDLKRDFSSHRRDSSNVTLPVGPLFERYQFFSPGLFMAFIVSIVLFSILYVAISGVSGLQVSYAAFDKEVGAAQKKEK